MVTEKHKLFNGNERQAKGRNVLLDILLLALMDAESLL